MTEIRSIELGIAGMTCAHCAQSVVQAIEAVDGVLMARVDLEGGGSARVELAGDCPRNIRQSIAEAVRSAGYRVARQGGKSRGAGLWLGLGSLSFLLAAEWLLGWQERQWYGPLAFLLALPVQAVLGLPFYRNAWRSLKAGRTGMDALVSLGSTTAFVYSAALLAMPDGPRHLHFVESVGILSLVSLGHAIERRVARRAGGRVETLLSLCPDTARREEPGGGLSQVPTASLLPGDRVLVSPGERIPVDAVVRKGESSCDLSMLTGESLPVARKPGDEVHAGTLNLTGAISVEATGVGRETALFRIVRMAEEARQIRHGLQRLADRISAVFVPVVILAALAAFSAWFLLHGSMSRWHEVLSGWLWEMPIPASPLGAGVVFAASVLIVACPCAMGLATPIAILAGSHAAASRGILMRNGRALELSGQIGRMVFDKTGTLTLGRPEVAGFRATNGDYPESLLGRICGSLASLSRHPYSRAVARWASGPPLETAEWREIAGKGLEARVEVEGRKLPVRLGSLSWTGAEEEREPESAPGRPGDPRIALSVDGRVSCLLVLRDPAKPRARDTLERLRSQGVSVSLLSGDREETVRSLAEDLGISSWIAEASPQDKARYIAQRREAGERVCFVGDGINDAPALEAADLGIAVARASDLARDSADMVLVRSDIQALPQAIAIARATRSTIRQNLFWAFFYNALGIPLAFLGFLSPLFCALAMGLSDLVVVGNAIRLRHRRFPSGP